MEKYFLEKILLLTLILPLMIYSQVNPYQNPDLPVDQRVKDLVNRMTLTEKISQMSDEAPAIERLGIQRYKWWNECVHGVVIRNATVFPQAIGMGSTWDKDHIFKVATAISDEARAAYHKRYDHGRKPIEITEEQLAYDMEHKYIEDNEYSSFTISGLTFWTPVVNMGRDPRWGRTQECWGEDPHFVSTMGTAFVKGLQGDNPEYLKLVSTPKHFAVNNEEWNRHFGSAEVNQRMLREYYLPQFESCITEGNAHSVMSAYNAVNGVPCSVNKKLLRDILREEWDFNGYVVSDCGAVADVIFNHKYIMDKEKAVAAVVKAGLDLECECCGDEESLFDNYLGAAVKKGYISEAEIDTAVSRLMRARFLLGMFDPPEEVPYSKIPEDIIESEKHKKLALETARKSIILLENKNNFLPLDKDNIKSLAVIGPNANVCRFGNYTGVPENPITPLEGIKAAAGKNTSVKYAKGCEMNTGEIHKDDLKIAKDADAVILCVGTSLETESEGLDRESLDLPQGQLELIQQVYKINKKVAVVLINGGPLSVNWCSANIPAMIEAWYPGQSGGTAIADVLFGNYNPAGRLPMTCYKSVDQLLDFSEYDITKGQTYLYFEKEPLYPFGYGLSYTSFTYDNLVFDNKSLNLNGNIDLKVKFDIENSGKLKGEEVVQLYVKDLNSSVKQPIKELRSFDRIKLGKGESKTVCFKLTNQDFSYWSTEKNGWNIEPGKFEIMIGASSERIRLKGIVRILD